MSIFISGKKNFRFGCLWILLFFPLKGNWNPKKCGCINFEPSNDSDSSKYSTDTANGSTFLSRPLLLPWAPPPHMPSAEKEEPSLDHLKPAHHDLSSDLKTKTKPELTISALLQQDHLCPGAGQRVLSNRGTWAPNRTTSALMTQASEGHGTLLATTWASLPVVPTLPSSYP